MHRCGLLCYQTEEVKFASQKKVYGTSIKMCQKSFGGQAAPRRGTVNFGIGP